MVKLFNYLLADSHHEVPAVARRNEEIGFERLYVAETKQDPFMQLALAAQATEHVTLGTGITPAFARSPMVLAYSAWDLQKASRGRFILGLGTQVRGHNERRFSVPWSTPGPRLREVVEAIRAIWDCWQNGTRLDYQGEHYRFQLMTPMFDAGPIDHPFPKIELGGHNPKACALAGEISDGLNAHGIHTKRFLEENTVPAFLDGVEKSGRRPEEVELSAPAMMVVGGNSEEMSAHYETIRKQISFYGATRTYSPVFKLHGWKETYLELHALAAENTPASWEKMPSVVTDEQVETFAVVGTPEEIPDLLRAKYDGLVDRVSPYYADPMENPERWKAIARELNQG
ncbi:MAG: LLM class F420-dependent oxidoreductase [Deltaproteobacteria bacterium]|jgi:probable F420-dependent oxidoreductase|nr:LLM class F420-dependent oxidoreductase [Deltaproteobacteria bacterium]